MYLRTALTILLTTLACAQTQAKVDFTHVIGIELLIAEGSSKHFESKWGHAMIRLVDDNDEPFDDQILTFEAMAPANNVSYAKAVTTGYPLGMTVTDLGEVIRSYMVGEKRGLKRIVLPMGSSRRKAFVRAVRSYENYPDQLGQYDFLANNCATGAIELLQSSGFYVSKEDISPRNPYGLDLVNPPLRWPTVLAKYIAEHLQTNLPFLYEAPPTGAEFPRFTTVPRPLYFACGRSCLKTYQTFALSHFKKLALNTLKTASLPTYRERKNFYAIDAAIQSHLRFPRQLPFEAEEFQSNAYLIRTLSLSN